MNPTVPEGLLGRTREALGFAALLLPGRRHARRIYDFLTGHNLPGEDSLFINLGYWADPGVRTIDDASRALADAVAEGARLGPGKRLLDCGFGYGDQDIHWIHRFNPTAIDGVNV